jgi:diguanylate cyclase (GGDEF)-like protein
MPAADLDLVLDELLSLRGDVCAKAAGDLGEARNPDGALAVFRLCRGLDLQTWRALTQRHDLKNWITIPIGPEAYPHLREIQHKLDTLAYAERHDPATGLDNRRAFEQGLDLEMERARRAETPVSLALVEIIHPSLSDGQKDSQAGGCKDGQAGQALLAAAARLLRTFKRRYDLAAHLGNGRFALVFSGLGQTKARHLLEKLATELAGLSLPGGGGGKKALTCHVGLTSYRGKTECAINRLVALADEALAQARRGGPGRVASVSSPDVDFGPRETLVLASEKQFLFNKG